MINLIRSYFVLRRIKGLFGEYISPAMVQRMVASGEKPVVEPSDIELTPFFASIHSFVSIAEQMPLPLLHELINTYFDACVTEIQGEGGTLDKFIGDAIVAMFGAPLRSTDHALRACVAALKCQARVAEFRERMCREGDKWPERARQLRIRIGLNTGISIVGNMGTNSRFNFTMLGDNVNLAARMESGAKSWGVWTMCTDATRCACEKAEPGRILFRSLGKILVKGRSELVELFEPVALRENATDRQCECMRRFEAGLTRWQQRDWRGAIDLFEQSAQIEPHQIDPAAGIVSNPSTVFLNMARSFRDHPDTGPLVV